jgi:hypothetical protein
MPMAASILANGSQLLRLVVPKALVSSTAQIMQAKLGGLVGRQLRHIPFSRRTHPSRHMLQSYESVHLEMMKNCGVILTTPEHSLSFNLCGLQYLADSKTKEAETMIKLQKWLNTNCRDILDESDFTLSVKTQLIYPSGPQTSVDGHPHRWLAAEEFLSLISDHLPKLQRDHPNSIEVINRGNGFPILHVLNDDVEEKIQMLLLNDICQGRTLFLRFKQSVPISTRHALRSLLSKAEFSARDLQKMLPLFADESSAYKKILLIRGLLMNNILVLCLKKRWNVQYGLHPGRDPLAVPFEAKGVPSEQAEFGHPDVAIILTILAFYFSGLTMSQFRDGLRHVLSSDDPSAEYDRWAGSCNSLPKALKFWNIINLDDEGQVNDLWTHLRLNQSVLNHYMNNFVFPRLAKQFSIKLQASGWDLPLFSGSKHNSASTVGFSGTNDNKSLLPLTIKQDDLSALKQTNAEVLTYLLRPQNRSYIHVWRDGKRLTEEGLLHKIASESIKVLIDAGAYILEMDNQTLVKSWLKADHQAKAAVYFGPDNRAWVQYRGTKRTAPLLSTPFAENLDECLVYIDEAHTRGVDLKLPKNACGALTLALGQTKDHTVQGASKDTLSFSLLNEFS